MVGFLERVGSLVARAGDGFSGRSSKPTSTFATDKATAVASYAEFCTAGKTPAYPLEVFLEISNICDLKCAMCVQFSALNPHRLTTIKETPRGFMDQGEISGNLEQVLKHALLVHCFGYGEPTIHPTFRSFLELVSRYEVMIDFFTNGMHLDEDFCRFLVDRSVYQITVSFSGATKETYEGIYIGGNFEKVLGGIRRLAEIKKEKGSRYPIIEVNSLGFHDHVAEFDKFVTVMADNGVNVVFLKPLQSYDAIPQLHEHVSVMRPDQEGRIVGRAMAIGRRRGVRVVADLYIEDGAADDRDHEKRMNALRQEAEKDLGASGRGFGMNPVADFGALAADLEPIRNPDQERREPRVLGLDVPEAVAERLLDVRPMQEDGSSEAPFHCMEPFKTLYISRNGAAKPCCFANPTAWYLGDVKKDEALDVWRGEGFRVVRDAIAKASYPMKSCKTCLQSKQGPQRHGTSRTLKNYLSWHEDNFSRHLRGALATQAPGALRAISGEPTDAIMARLREESGRHGLPAARSFRPAVSRPEQFVAQGDCYLHRDFVADQPASRISPASPGDSSDLARLLQHCAMQRYTGRGSIVDLGSDPGPLLGLIAGLRANPQFAAIVASFQARRDTPIRRFALAASENDIADSAGIVGRQVGDVSKIQWLASQPVEICVVHGAVRSTLLRRALLALFPFFVPGETLLVHSDFYSQAEPYPKVFMGYLGDSFEWLGQAGTSAVFRLVKPLPADMLALDPHKTLSNDLCFRFHRQWENADLSRGIQMRLDLSLARLVARKSGVDEALANVDRLRDEYADLLDPKAPTAIAWARMIERCRNRIQRQVTALGIRR